MNTSFALGAVLISVLGTAPVANAQDAKPYFVTVNVGAQPKQRELTATQTLTVYSETATINSVVDIKNGPIVEIGGGRKIWGDIAVGVRFSSFMPKKKDGIVVASIPDPFFFNRPKTVTQALPEPEHKENGIHIQALWIHAFLGQKLEVALSGGPSIIKVTQELAGQATVPVGTQNLVISKVSEKGTAKGYNVGLDTAYMFTPMIGAGVFVRMAQGTVDLPSAQGLEVGGVQAGIGARIRF